MKILRTSVKYFFSFLFFLPVSLGAHAFNMLEYFPLQTGNLWEYDRDLFVVSSETATLGGDEANYFISAREFYDGSFFIRADSDGIAVVGLREETGSILDLSSYPVTIATAEMDIGDGIQSIIPANVLEPGAPSVTITSTLIAVTSVTVPAGTFDSTLNLRIVVDESAYSYTERLWLAKSIGIVKIQKGSFTSNDGSCLFSCGCFDDDFDIVEDRNIDLVYYRHNSPNVNDSDGDGIIDTLDRCAATPEGSLVDSDGCAGKPKLIVVPL